MREINIKSIVEANFGGKFDDIEVKEYFKGMYEILHSPGLNIMIARDIKYGSITGWFPVAEVNLTYRNVRLKVIFKLSLEMYWVGDEKYIRPYTNIDNISIEEPVFNDEVNSDWFNRKVASGGGFPSTAGLACEGHPACVISKDICKILSIRIIKYFEYLISCMDYATDKNVGSPEHVFDVDLPAGEHKKFDAVEYYDEHYLDELDECDI